MIIYNFNWLDVFEQNPKDMIIGRVIEILSPYASRSGPIIVLDVFQLAQEHQQLCGPAWAVLCLAWTTWQVIKCVKPQSPQDHFKLGISLVL